MAYPVQVKVQASGQDWCRRRRYLFIAYALGERWARLKGGESQNERFENNGRREP